MNAYPVAMATGAVTALKCKSSRAWLAVFTAIACTYLYNAAFYDPILRSGAMVCLFGGLFFAGTLTGRAMQVVAAALIATLLIQNWILFANHGFMITYFAMFFAVCAVTRPDFWAHATWFARTMIMLVMGAALIQKLMSPYYMSGNMMGEMLLSGQFFVRIFKRLYSGSVETFEQTRVTQNELLSNYDLQQAGGIALPEIGLFLLLAAYGITVTSLVAQGVLEAALIWHRRIGIWLHRIILCFTFMVYSLTSENIFLSLNLMIGYALTDEHSKSMRIPYLLGIAYLLLSLLFQFRPLVLR